MPAPSSEDDGDDEATGDVEADGGTADGSGEEPSYPDVSSESRFVTGFALWRESGMAAFGVLAVVAGLNGFDRFLASVSAYPFEQFLWEVGLVFLGVYLLVAAAGAAARRVRMAG